MMIAKEGIWFIVAFFTATTVLLFLALRLSNLFLLSVAMLLGILCMFTTYFFRDPDRQIVAQEGVILAPADGKIVRIAEIDHHPHIGGPARQISIFLSALDVHINRVPVSGVIDYVRYVPGKYLLAWRDKASKDNERTEIGITTSSGEKIAFRQIAGTVARRIVCYLSPGDSVSIGNRFGLIRFGSRMDVILSADTELIVKIGDRVQAGLTPIGRLSIKGENDAD